MWKKTFGAIIFLGKRKIDEKIFKSQKELVWWLHKNDKQYGAKMGVV